MIHTLELENYRGFQRYKLSDLARVNLLVGKNNSGKTSILEAVFLIASGGDLRRTLIEIATQRGDLTYEAEESQIQRVACLDFSRFFFGYDFSSGSKFSIRSDDLRSVVLQIEEAPVAHHLPSDGGMLFNARRQVTISSDKPGQLESYGFNASSSEDGLVRIDGLLSSFSPNRERAATGSARFVSQDSLNRDAMIELW